MTKVLKDPVKRNTKPLRVLFVTGQEMHCYFFRVIILRALWVIQIWRLTVPIPSMVLLLV